MKILIPNATGPTNIGDQAILIGLLKIIESTYSNYELTIHSSTPEKYINFKYKVKPHLYYWAAFESRIFFSRIFRLFELFFQYLFTFLNLNIKSFSLKLNDLIKDYRESDLIIFVGGGFFRTTSGITQSMNLFMILFQFSFAKLFKAKKIVAPGSFGPFAYKWQERLSAKVLQGFDIITVREDISYNLLKKYGFENLIISADQALLLDALSPKNLSHEKLILGYTLRNWGNEKDQIKNNKMVVEAIAAFAKKVEIVVHPILQVDAPDFGDLDSKITQEVAEQLKNQGISVRDTSKPTSLTEAIDIYSHIDILLGMRMHSNIITATQLKPFVAIAYEHKTRGVSRMLGLEEYCLDYGHFSENDLFNVLEKVYKNRTEIIDKIAKKLSELKEIELTKWSNILIQYAK